MFWFAVWKKIEEKCKRFKPKKCILSSIPAIKWLGRYRWKTDIVADLIAGFTVAIMHIPQGKYFFL